MAFDFAAAKQAGYSDAEIVSFLAQDKNGKFDVDGALKAGYSPSEIVQHLSKTEAAPASTGFIDAVKQGAANVVGGLGETVEQYAGKGVVSDALKRGADAVRPANYDQAKLYSTEEGFTPSEAPRVIAENAPGIGAGVLAAKLGNRVGGKVGAAVAAMAAYMALTRGDEAKRAADARTGVEGTEPTTEDKTRAALYGIPESVLAAVGANRFLPGGSTRGVVDAGKRLLTTTAVEGGVGAGQNLIQQAGSTVGTEGGLKVDPAETINAGLTNAVVGGSMAGPRAAKDLNNVRKGRAFNDFAPQEVEIAANRIKDAADGDLSNTKVAFKAVRDTEANVANELRRELQNVKDASPDVQNILARATQTKDLTSKDFDALRTADLPESVKSLAATASIISRLKGQGVYKEGKGVFKGGVSAKLDESLRVLMNPWAVGATAGLGLLGAGAGGVTGAFVVPALPAIGATVAGYGASRLLDRFTGARSPAKRFVDQFSNDATLIRPARAVPQDEQAVERGPWNPAPKPSVAGIGTRPVGVEDLPRGPWNPAPSPQVGAFGKGARPVPAEEVVDPKFNPRSNVIVEEGMAGVADDIAKERAKKIRAVEAALAKHAKRTRNETTDIPPFLPKREAPQPTTDEALAGLKDALKTVGFMMKTRQKSDALADKDAAAKQKAAGDQEAERIAAASPLVEEVGGLGAIKNPAVGKRAGQLVAAANAIKRLTAEPSEEKAPAVVTKVKKTGGKVEQETDTGEYVPPRSAYADLEPHVAAERFLKDAQANGKGVKYPSGFKAGITRNLIEIRSAARGVAAEVPTIDAKEVAAQFEGITRNGDPFAHREWLKKQHPEASDAIDTYFSDEMIKRVWKHKAKKK